MNGYSIGKIFGIDVQVHGSWLVIGALILWTLASNTLPVDYPQLAAGVRLGMALVITALFFVSLLAHELAHSVVAMARGIPVHRITFFLFGGMAQTSSESRSAGEEFVIAIAGPLMSFLLGGLFYALWTLGSSGAWGPFLVGSAAYLTVLNLVLGTFNLLPGFPMDGGRVLRSIIWKATGNVTRATLWASRVGSGMAMLLMAYGLWEVFTGSVISGLWLIFIGMFIRNAARSAYQNHLVGRMQELAKEAWTAQRMGARFGPRTGTGGGTEGPGGRGRETDSGRAPDQDPDRDQDWPPPGRDVSSYSEND
jgi:Zn-dependent protease